MDGWIFLVMFWVNPGAMPAAVVYGPYPDKATCERARWVLQLKNIPNFYVQGCEVFHARH